MKKNIKSGLICLMLAALSISSCKKFLNVNTNPNVAQTATAKTLLPAAQLYVGSSVGVDLEIDGSFWAQYWTQNPGASQYHSLDLSILPHKMHFHIRGPIYMLPLRTFSSCINWLTLRN